MDEYLFPSEKEGKTKRIKIRPAVAVPAIILALVMVLQLFTIRAYATVYCRGCGSPIICADDGVTYYHMYVNSAYACEGSQNIYNNEAACDADGNGTVTEKELKSYYFMDTTEDAYNITSPYVNVQSNANAQYWKTASYSVSFDSDEGDFTYTSLEETTDSSDIMLAGPLIDFVFGLEDTSSADSIMEPLTVLDNACGYIVNAMETIMSTSFYRCLQVIGMTFLSLYFVMEFMNNDLRRHFGTSMTEAYLIPFLKLFISLLIMVNLWQFLQFFLYLAQFAYYQMESLGDMSSVLEITGVDDIKTLIGNAAGYDFEQHGTGWALLFGGEIKAFIFNVAIGAGIALTFLLPTLLTAIANIVAVWAIMSRTVNLVITGTLAPLAMTDLYSGVPLAETKAFAYLKSFAALSFQCVTIALAFYIANIIAEDYLATLLGAAASTGTLHAFGVLAFYITVLKIVQVVAVVSSGRTAKDVFGVA